MFFHQRKEQLLSTLKYEVKTLAIETWQTSWTLIRIVIPVLVITKVLELLGLIDIISVLFKPLMALMGLPGELGLVWATAMCTSIYGGLAVFMSLSPVLDLTSAQITTLGAIILIAHSLPVELSVSSKAGAKLLPIAAARFFGALFYGMLFGCVCNVLNLLQDQPQLFFQAPEVSGRLGAWAWGQFCNLLMIVVIICAILIIMRFLRWCGVLDLLERLLSPILPIFGMSEKAAPLTVIGMLMGISYGGALIIREVSMGKLSKEEVFNTMLLLGLCHSLVEDTLLVAAMGAKFIGILWGRLLFSLIVLFVWVRLQSVFSGGAKG